MLKPPRGNLFQLIYFYISLEGYPSQKASLPGIDGHGYIYKSPFLCFAIINIDIASSKGREKKKYTFMLSLMMCHRRHNMLPITSKSLERARFFFWQNPDRGGVTRGNPPSSFWVWNVHIYSPLHSLAISGPGSRITLVWNRNGEKILSPPQ